MTVVPEPAGGDGFTIERSYYTPDGEPMDIATVAQNQRVVVVLTVTADQGRDGHVMVVDPMPAGYEIENPTSRRAATSPPSTGSTWSGTSAHTEARTDRFVAALDRSDGDPLELQRRLCDAGGVARHLRAAGRDGRGHVPARAQGADGERHRRGRRADAVGRPQAPPMTIGAAAG